MRPRHGTAGRSDLYLPTDRKFRSRRSPSPCGRLSVGAASRAALRHNSDRGSPPPRSKRQNRTPQMRGIAVPLGSRHPPGEYPDQELNPELLVRTETRCPFHHRGTSGRGRNRTCKGLRLVRIPTGCRRQSACPSPLRSKTRVPVPRFALRSAGPPGRELAEVKPHDGGLLLGRGQEEGFGLAPAPASRTRAGAVSRAAPSRRPKPAPACRPCPRPRTRTPRSRSARSARPYRVLPFRHPEGDRMPAR